MKSFYKILFFMSYILLLNLRNVYFIALKRDEMIQTAILPLNLRPFEGGFIVQSDGVKVITTDFRDLGTRSLFPVRIDVVLSLL